MTMMTAILEFLRQYRFGAFSIFDTVASYGGVYLLAPPLIRWFGKVHVRLTRGNVLWLVLPVAVLTHIVLGLHTPFTKMVLDPSGHYLAKAAVLAMLYLGLRGVAF
jgi:hypothetical protein